MFKRILVGVDPTHEEEGPAALKEALRLLNEGGEIIVLTVVAYPEEPPFFPVLREPDSRAPQEEAERALNVLIRKAVPRGLNVRPLVITGRAGPGLLEVAEENGAELIVLVEHGHIWPLRRDTVQYVCVHTPVPVLVLPVPGKADSAS